MNYSFPSIRQQMKWYKIIGFLFVLIMVSTDYLHAQSDSLVILNGDVIRGDLKVMERGVLTFETTYAENDFEIDWDEIKEIYSGKYFYVKLSNGKHYYAWINSKDSLVELTTKDSTVVHSEFSKIVQLIPVNQGFKYRFNAQIDLGFGLTKANNLRQFTASGKIGYKSENWLTYLRASGLNSIQDSTEPISRVDGEYVFKYIINKDWYFIPSATYLTSTELQLNARWNILLGFGNFLVRSNKAYWGVIAGFARNIEDYYGDFPDRYSWEGYFGTEVNLFNTGDITLFTKAVAYPGITESGRWRVDWKFNIKYNLPVDFYVKLGFIMNYDNRPIEGTSDVDYVSTFSIGWKWDRN